MKGVNPLAYQRHGRRCQATRGRLPVTCPRPRPSTEWRMEEGRAGRAGRVEDPARLSDQTPKTVNAMGGNLPLIGRFPDRPRQDITAVRPVTFRISVLTPTADSRPESWTSPAMLPRGRFPPSPPAWLPPASAHTHELTRRCDPQRVGRRREAAPWSSWRPASLIRAFR